MIRERRGSMFHQDSNDIQSKSENDTVENGQARKRNRSFDDKEEEESKNENGIKKVRSGLDLLGPEELKLAKEASGKINKEVIKAVKQSDICLFCNLQDLFTKYEYDSG